MHLKFYTPTPASVPCYEPEIDLTGAKILLVDDIPTNLDVLSQALDAENYELLVATRGETALKVAHNRADRI